MRLQWIIEISDLKQRVPHDPMYNNQNQEHKQNCL